MGQGRAASREAVRELREWESEAGGQGGREGYRRTQFSILYRYTHSDRPLNVCRRPKKAAGRVGLAEPAAPAAQAASAAQAEPAKSVRRGAGRRVGGTGGAE